MDGSLVINRTTVNFEAPGGFAKGKGACNGFMGFGHNILMWISP